MNTPNTELMKSARVSLTNKWGLAIITFLVYSLISGTISYKQPDNDVANSFSMIQLILLIVVAGPLILGASIFSLNIARDNNPKFSDLFDGFKNFGTAIGAYVLIAIFTILWSLLLIVPGIIAAISYSMTFYIIADDNTIRAMDAIDKSKTMMYGYKMKYFKMVLRFIGWSLLCLLTLGIGFLWLIPYIYVSNAKFYEDIKDNPISIV